MIRDYREVVIVGILIIACLILILLFANVHREEAEYIRVLNNGKSIYTTIHQLGMFDTEESLLHTQLRFPSSGKYRNSTEYFRSVYRGGILNTNYNLLSAPGVPEFNGKDHSLLSPINNTWCIVTDLSGSAQDGSVPYYFTKNVCIETLEEDIKPQFVYGHPFQNKGAVIIAAGGGGYILKGEKKVLEYFNLNHRTNKVLRP